MMSETAYKTPCPYCRGVVVHTHISDCSYNDSSSIECKGCKRVFRSGAWEKIARKEIEEEENKRKIIAEKKRKKKLAVEKRRQEITKRALRKLTRAEKKALGF